MHYFGEETKSFPKVCHFNACKHLIHASETCILSWFLKSISMNVNQSELGHPKKLKLQIVLLTIPWQFVMLIGKSLTTGRRVFIRSTRYWSSSCKCDFHSIQTLCLSSIFWTLFTGYTANGTLNIYTSEWNYHSKLFTSLTPWRSVVQSKNVHCTWVRGKR